MMRYGFIFMKFRIFHIIGGCGYCRRLSLSASKQCRRTDNTPPYLSVVICPISLSDARAFIFSTLPYGRD